jgi:ferric-dicitrate binding protein FerR (iron transport regulator)
MFTDTQAMRIAEKRARSARKTLDASRRSNRGAETVASAPADDENVEQRPAKPPLRSRLRLLLAGALVALALAAGAFVAFDAGDGSPSERLDGSPAPATDVGAPAGDFDPRP